MCGTEPVAQKETVDEVKVAVGHVAFRPIAHPLHQDVNFPPSSANLYIRNSSKRRPFGFVLFALVIKIIFSNEFPDKHEIFTKIMAQTLDTLRFVLQ